MGLILRKTLTNGPLRTSISKSGVGWSIGFSCLHVGVAATGRLYFAIGIPGTGLYYKKYLGVKWK